MRFEQGIGRQNRNRDAPVKTQTGFQSRGLPRGRNRVTRASSNRISSGSMKSCSSGMSRQITRLFARWRRNGRESLARCAFSMTKMRSAHSTFSAVRGLSASLLRPAEALQTGVAREHLLDRWAAQAIATAEKNDPRHRSPDARSPKRDPVAHAAIRARSGVPFRASRLESRATKDAHRVAALQFIVGPPLLLA